MPEQTDIPISSLPDAESITDADKVTGLQGNANKNFTFSSIKAWFVNAVKSAFVPVSRTINGKTLDTNITLNASDVGARPDTWTPSAADVGAIPATEAGEPMGIAELDSDGKVPSNQLPAIPSQPSDIGAQDEITASGILKGDGQGGVTAAVAGTDYQAPLTAGTDYATPAQLADKAAKADLTSIQATGTTNTTGAAIPAGAYFYLNGVLHRAKTQIDVNVPFTVNTNCEQATEGGLNTLNNNILDRSRQMNVIVPAGKSVDIILTGNNYAPSHGFFVVCTGNSGSVIAAWLCIGFGIRTTYHVVTNLHASASTALSLTSTVNGKYTLTNSNQSYQTYMTVTVLQESPKDSLSLSEPY